MTIGQIILGIVLFAVATAILYAWGLGKSLDQQSTLERNLRHACGSKILRYLKKHETISKKEIAKLIEGVTVGQAWSRNKLKIQSGKEFAPQIIDFLLEQQYIESIGNNTYRLKK